MQQQKQKPNTIVKKYKGSDLLARKRLDESSKEFRD